MKFVPGDPRKNFFAHQKTQGKKGTNNQRVGWSLWSLPIIAVLLAISIATYIFLPQLLEKDSLVFQTSSVGTTCSTGGGSPDDPDGPIIKSTCGDLEVCISGTCQCQTGTCSIAGSVGTIQQQGNACICVENLPTPPPSRDCPDLEGGKNVGDACKATLNNFPVDGFVHDDCFCQPRYVRQGTQWSTCEDIDNLECVYKGIQYAQEVICYDEENGSTVRDGLCDAGSKDNVSKFCTRDTTDKACNNGTGTCKDNICETNRSYSWVAEEFPDCDDAFSQQINLCRESITLTRQVYCTDQMGQEIADANCDPDKKPESTETCTRDTDGKGCGLGKACVDGGCTDKPTDPGDGGEETDGPFSWVADRTACVRDETKTACSKVGIQRVIALRCLDGEGTQVDDRYCDSIPKPTDQTCPYNPEGDICEDGVCTRDGRCDTGSDDPPSKLPSMRIQLIPSSILAGEDATLTITLLKPDDTIYTDYVGDVSISIDDVDTNAPGVKLPGNGIVTFTAEDQGTKTFINSVSLAVSGTYTLRTVSVMYPTVQASTRLYILHIDPPPPGDDDGGTCEEITIDETITVKQSTINCATSEKEIQATLKSKCINLGYKDIQDSDVSCTQISDKSISLAGMVTCCEEELYNRRRCNDTTWELTEYDYRTCTTENYSSTREYWHGQYTCTDTEPSADNCAEKPIVYKGYVCTKGMWQSHYNRCSEKDYDETKEYMEGEDICTDVPPADETCIEDETPPQDPYTRYRCNDDAWEVLEANGCATIDYDVNESYMHDAIVCYDRLPSHTSCQPMKYDQYLCDNGAWSLYATDACEKSNYDSGTLYPDDSLVCHETLPDDTTCDLEPDPYHIYECNDGTWVTYQENACTQIDYNDQEIYNHSQQVCAEQEPDNGSCRKKEIPMIYTKYQCGVEGDWVVLDTNACKQIDYLATHMYRPFTIVCNDILPNHTTCLKRSTGGGINYCGDGITRNGEQCDDGNAKDGDGCSRNCEIEHDAPDESPKKNLADLIRKSIAIFDQACAYHDEAYKEIMFKDTQRDPDNEPINILKAYCIVKGYDRTWNTRYHTDEATSVAEAIKVITKVEAMEHGVQFYEGESYRGQMPYTDMTRTAWYTPYVLYATEFDWLDGLARGKHLKALTPVSKSSFSKLLRNVGKSDNYRELENRGKYLYREDMAHIVVDAYEKKFRDYAYLYGNNITIYKFLLKKLERMTPEKQHIYVGRLIKKLKQLDHWIMGEQYNLHLRGLIAFLEKTLEEKNVVSEVHKETLDVKGLFGQE